MFNENKTITLDSLKSIFSAFEQKLLKQNSVKQIEPQQMDVPTVYITGEVPTKKENVKAKIEYISKTHRFTAYMKYKLQGSYSLTSPKKNFTIQLFKDKNRLNPYYENFKGWGKSNRFVLKADYFDITHARNIVCAKLWSKVVQSRPDYESLPEELKNSPNHGATDGFPILVYLNNEFQGMYTLVIPKDAWMFGMDKNNENHVVLNAENNDNRNEDFSINPCNFNAPWSGKDGEYWSYEVGSNALESWMGLYQGFDNYEQLQKSLDISSAIDYYIFQSVTFNLDGLAKNMNLITYDKVKWYLSVYDLDSTFGLTADQNYSEYVEAWTGDYPYLNQYSRLWEYINVHYMAQLRERYTELRKGALSYASIAKEFEDFIGIYGEDEYIKDVSVYPDIPHVAYNNLNNLRTFIAARLEFLDSYWLTGGGLDE